METLRRLADGVWSSDDWQQQDERMPREIIDKLATLGLYDMGRNDLDNYAFTHDVDRRESTVRIRTEESEIQGFIKLLLHHGGKVEVLSRHNWNDDGTAKTTAGE
ncbi:hypothetical protein FL583_22160 [Cryptosporangium phraense]|uniref:Uncharacterized protein n=1 Tax=Cryptosporangium phraense TaxID=2593070 RepID=A0A545AND3_9ACTN|nr:hypothetical protein FL583_22160 [Cryptosporangium phraense]